MMISSNTKAPPLDPTITVKSVPGASVPPEVVTMRTSDAELLGLTEALALALLLARGEREGVREPANGEALREFDRDLLAGADGLEVGAPLRVCEGDRDEGGPATTEPVRVPVKDPVGVAGGDGELEGDGVADCEAVAVPDPLAACEEVVVEDDDGSGSELLEADAPELNVCDDVAAEDDVPVSLLECEGVSVTLGDSDPDRLDVCDCVAADDGVGVPESEIERLGVSVPLPVWDLVASGEGVEVAVNVSEGV